MSASPVPIARGTDGAAGWPAAVKDTVKAALGQPGVRDAYALYRQRATVRFMGAYPTIRRGEICGWSALSQDPGRTLRTSHDGLLVSGLPQGHSMQLGSWPSDIAAILSRRGTSHVSLSGTLDVRHDVTAAGRQDVPAAAWTRNSVTFSLIAALDRPGTQPLELRASIGNSAGDWEELISDLEITAASIVRTANGTAAATRTLPAGHYPAVLAPGIGGVLLHEAVGHRLEGSSPAHNRPGLLASRIVTAVDDPTIPGAIGSYRLDDYGDEPRPVVLIDNGAAAGTLSTWDNGTGNGHGRRESHHHDILARMSNTDIRPGPDQVEDILRAATAGIYVTDINKGHYDEVAASVTLGVAAAHRLAGAELAEPLRPFTMRIPAATALNGVEMLASDFTRRGGRCVKQGQSMAVSTGSPTLLLASAEVL